MNQQKVIQKFIEQAYKYLQIENVDKDIVTGIEFIFEFKPPEWVIRALRDAEVIVKWLSEDGSGGI